MNEEWRFIDSGACSASLNMAIDEAIAQSVREGSSPPTLRVYAWTVPSVSIGCFQKIDSVDLSYCAAMGIPVVRRPTGGRAILHGEELTYSFSASTAQGLFSKGLMDSYRQISAAFCRAISVLGLSPEAKTERSRNGDDSGNPLCFQSTSFAEIALENRKVVGSAQKRWRDGLLQQGSIPYVVDEERARRVFNLDAPTGITDKMIGLKDVVPGLDPEVFKEAIRRSFEETFGVSLIRSALSREEYLPASELEARRYLSPEWTHQR